MSFSWVHSSFNGKPDNFMTSRNRFALLQNDVSTPSDENGIAVFQNLTVVGTTLQTFYLFLSCDNAVVLLWSHPISQLSKDLVWYTPPLHTHILIAHPPGRVASESEQAERVLGSDEL